MQTSYANETSKFFTDLPSLIVDGFQPAAGAGEGWMAVEYELDTFKGIGLATGACSPAGELVLDLGLTGWHRLSLAHNPALRVWLDGENGYIEAKGDIYSISEVALPAADFTGRLLHIAPVRGAELSREVTLFYLRAEPCEPWLSHRNLIITDDGYGCVAEGMDGPRDIYRHIYPFRDSDVFRMLWGVYGGGVLSMNEASQLTQSPIRPETHFYYGDEWKMNRSLQRIRDTGSDVLQVVRDATRECGLELHYYVRMSAFYGPYPHLGWNTRLFLEHPEWRCRDEHGQTINFISYAYPQVQDYLLACWNEFFDYDPEGLCLAFNRGLPLMVCEERCWRRSGANTAVSRGSRRKWIHQSCWPCDMNC